MGGSYTSTNTSLEGNYFAFGDWNLSKTLRLDDIGFQICKGKWSTIGTTFHFKQNACHGTEVIMHNTEGLNITGTNNNFFHSGNAVPRHSLHRLNVSND